MFRRVYGYSIYYNLFAQPRDKFDTLLVKSLIQGLTFSMRLTVKNHGRLVTAERVVREARVLSKITVL